MVFQEQPNSVLVVSASLKFNGTLAPLLPGTDFWPVCYADTIAGARRELHSRSFDFVIINAPLPDDSGVRFACDVCAGGGSVAMLLVREEMVEQIHEKVAPCGVFVLPKPIPVQTLRLGLKWMAAVRARLRRMEKKAASVEEKTEELRLMNHAKWLLMTHRDMTEAQAHRYLEKQAMDRSLSRREVAQEIVQAWDGQRP